MLNKEEIEVLKKLFQEIMQTKEKLDIRLKINKEVASYLLTCINKSEQLELKANKYDSLVKKIKDKIKEYKKKIKEAVKEDDDIKEIYYEQEIDILQELLKEIEE